MKVPPEIVLSGVERTPFIERLITKGIAKLEQVCNYIVSVRIALEWAQRRHQTGNSYRMRIDIRIPAHREIVVKRFSVAAKRIPDGLAELETRSALEGQPESESRTPIRRSPVRKRGLREEELPVLIRRTFDAARRELEKVVEKQRREVKLHAEQETQAVVEKIFREQDYGFLRTLDGEQIYFHKNSLLHNHWERLRVGNGVRYTPELGEKGLQASTVELVDKPGAAEMHEQLHDLPRVSSRRRA